MRLLWFCCDFYFIRVYKLVSPASKTLMMAGVWSMSRETLSNQPFSIRKVKTFRRLFRALWVSALSLLASSGWYLVLNLGSKFVPERGEQGMGWNGSKGVTCIIHILPHIVGLRCNHFTEKTLQKVYFGYFRCCENLQMQKVGLIIKSGWHN